MFRLNRRRSRRFHRVSHLRFSPTAWAKITFWRDVGPREIGAFGVSSIDDPLLIEDVELVQQECTPTSVSFLDEGVADFLDAKVDQGLELSRCSRVWVHSHPDNCPLPSAKDEETFRRVFGKCDWAVMAILACGGKTYARLQFSVGPRVTMPLKIIVDYNRPFQGSDESAWLREYDRCVHDRSFHFDSLREELVATNTSGSWTNPLSLDEAYDHYF